MQRLLIASVFAASMAPAFAGADVEIDTSELRDYQLPASFDLANAHIQKGKGGSTILSATTGESADEASCGVIVATGTDATLFEYRYDGLPTICVGVTPHPDGGFFVRGSNPTAQDGAVSGVTAYVDESGQQQWAIDDQRLVDAQPSPTGTGEFQGDYERPHHAMAYSPQLDKLLAFTVGKLVIGLDEKFLSQAHVVNASTGTLKISGQTFGQSGVGIVGGTTTRASDGHFLIYYFSSGAQGAFFYSYNGRQEIAFFRPREEDWDTRFVARMIYERDLLHLLWTPTDEPSASTRVTVVNDEAVDLWTRTWEAQYVFADGTPLELGRPLSMWVSADWTVVLYDAMGSLYLRVIDINGESLGVAPLEGAGEFQPIAIVNGTDDRLKLLTFDDTDRRVHEYWLDFVDIEDFDADMGIADVGDGDGGFVIPPDASLPGDVGLKDALEHAGCCTTVSPDLRSGPLPIVLLIAVTLAGRRRFLPRREN